MKKILLILLLITAFGNAQTEVDFSAMEIDTLLGEEIGIDIVCDGSINDEYITNIAIDFNGHVIAINNGTLTINGDVEFGGAFIGFCESTICINGTIFNSDPPDPGGDPFDDENGNTSNIEDYPDPIYVNECIDLPDGEFINYTQLHKLILANRALSINSYNLLDFVKYDNNTKILSISNVSYIKVYNLLGQKLIEGKNKVNLSYIHNEILIIKTDKGTFKKIINK